VRTCPSCGFENAEPGRPCPLCGSSESALAAAATLDAEAATLQMSAGRLAARAGREGSRRAVEPGSVVAERYEVLGLLGAGGMGEVYRVRDAQGGEERALKLIRAEDEDDPEREQRFRREIAVLSKIRHPAVPPVLDWGVSSGALFFVTEILPGPDLKLSLQQRGPWPIEEVCRVGASVADALQAAHAQGIVHRDVKPGNLMLAADGSVRLLDFGLARGHGVDMSTLTRTGVIVGTPAYMAPEQLDGRPVDERTDVYSLGVVLFELLTGTLPFQAPNAMALAVKHLVEPPPSPRALRPELPAWLERAVLRCLEKNPARRFPTAAALRAELAEPRTGRLRSRRLATGDLLLEDPGAEWAMALASASEKTGWALGMALRLEERLFRLDAIEAPREKGGRWGYRFALWPSEIVLRAVVDYEQDAAGRRSAADGSLAGRMRRLLRPGS
jgi:tRNA A-37 threonylcarbamoyl transferase component Bud32